MAIARTEARAHTTAPDRMDGRPDRRPVWVSAAGLVGALASTSCRILPVALFAPLFLTATLLCLGPITYDETRVTMPMLIEATTQAGYPSRVLK